MTNFSHEKTRFLSVPELKKQIRSFTKNMQVTEGSFELLVNECTVEDFEWNHMDQMHRPTIHKTYDKGVRIAFGAHYAISLTQWGKWPFFITVSDAYVDKGLFYQSLTLGGVIFLHCIISLEQINNSVQLKDEWIIASHKIFRFLHKPLSKKLYKLNKRLQEEDAQIRNGRFHLRKAGYQFKSDPADYYSSNIIANNTIYPALLSESYLLTENFTPECKKINVGGIEFLIKKKNEQYLIWPAVCPHEGGPLQNGCIEDTKIACPWHGLRFNAAELSQKKPLVVRYGFEYYLHEDKIFITQNNPLEKSIIKVTESTLEI